MLKFIAKRLVQNLVTIFLIALIIFVLFRVLPGDPTGIIVDPALSLETRQMLREKFGLDKPLYEQFALWLRAMITFDFGVSFYHRIPVQEILLPRLANSIILSLSILAVAFSIGVMLGAVMAWRYGTKIEIAASSIVLMLESAPFFWTALIAIMIFSFSLGLLPPGGMHTPGLEMNTIFDRYFSLDFLSHWILPTLIGGLYWLALPYFLMRNTMIEVLEEDFIDMAKAKGAGQKTLMFKHAARNALLPVVSSAALFTGLSIGGLVVLEYVFNWPGLGLTMVHALTNRDYPVGQAAFFVFSIWITALNLLSDILIGFLDPRITS